MENLINLVLELNWVSSKEVIFMFFLTGFSYVLFGLREN